ncbi:MAG TPA: hypothetical protein VE547_15490, partial [Mycobacteriales bacterium]|nr:hypothetical protein [Mycobacteriales bacterium]
VDRAAVEQAFGPLDVPAALVAAPDVMICAADPEAIARGDYRIVLSEVHPVLLATHKAMTLLHPDPAGLAAEGRRVLRELTAPEEQAVLSSRRISKIDSWLLGRPKINLEWAYGTADDRQVPVADVDVVLPERALPQLGLAGVPVPAHIEVPLVTEPAFPAFLLAFGRPAIWHQPVAGPGHSPRVEVDGVVFQRERWTLEAAALPEWRRPLDDPDNVVDLWRWKSRLGLPDQVFCRPAGAGGVKPFLVDFLSPLSCLAFVRETTPARPVVLTEMVPGPGELWLRDGTDRFTCELRFNVWRPRPEAPGDTGADRATGDTGGADLVTARPGGDLPGPAPAAVDLTTFATRLAALRALVEPLVTED